MHPIGGFTIIYGWSALNEMPVEAGPAKQVQEKVIAHIDRPCRHSIYIYIQYTTTDITAEVDPPRVVIAVCLSCCILCKCLWSCFLFTRRLTHSLRSIEYMGCMPRTVEGGWHLNRPCAALWGQVGWKGPTRPTGGPRECRGCASRCTTLKPLSS